MSGVIWVQVLLICVLSFVIYRNSRIKYSVKSVISVSAMEVSYRKLYILLAYSILFLNILMVHYSSERYSMHVSLRKYWYYLVPLLGVIVLYMMIPKGILDDGSFKSQPSMMGRRGVYRFHILLIVLLISSILIEVVKGKYFGLYENKKMAYVGISRIITLLIVVYLTIKEKNMSNCEYGLPKNWV